MDKPSFSYYYKIIVISYQGTKRNGFLTSRFFCQKYCRGWFFCSRARALARAREQKNHPKEIFEVKNGSQKTVSLRPRHELCFSCDWNTENEVFGTPERIKRFYDKIHEFHVPSYRVKSAIVRYYNMNSSVFIFSLFIFSLFIFIHFIFIILFKWKMEAIAIHCRWRIGRAWRLRCEGDDLASVAVW
jgi:hypothetical protein